MKISRPDEASSERWTLVRRARQLLTLHGAGGPRRGRTQNELNIIEDGAVLIRNGVIEEVGTSRRVENLAQARKAREVDAAGRVVMPAFVDPNAVLVYPRAAGMHSGEGAPPPRLHVLSKRRLALSGAAAAADWVRAGVLSAGAHTAYAEDLRDTIRILRVHQELQARPLRIRSILSPFPMRVERSPGDRKAAESRLPIVLGKWLAPVRQRQLATIVELAVEPDSLTLEQVREASIAAAGAGFAVRIRTDCPACPALLELALAAGAVALIAPPAETGEHLLAMADLGCVHVLSFSSALRDDEWREDFVRRELDAGIPIALASGFRMGGPTTLNPQFLLYLSVQRFGMTTEEAIAAATYNAACSLRLSHVTGSLEPGKAGDLLVMDVPDYHDLVHRVAHNDVLMAVKSGNTVYRRGVLTLD